MTAFIVGIYEDDGTTIKCSLQNVDGALTSANFSTCGLLPKTYYRASARAFDEVGNSIAASNSTYRFYVTGQGQLSFLGGASTNFGTLAVGLNSTRTLTLANPGTAPATSLAGTLALPFSYAGGSYPGLGGTCETTLNEGATCTLNVLFQPAAEGSSSQSFVFSYFDGTEMKSTTNTLNGTAILTPPTALRLSAPISVVANECQAVTVSSVTANGASSPMTSAGTISLAVNNGTGAFYNSITCSTAITSVVLSAGASSQTVYFRSSVSPQSLTLIATHPLLDATQVATTVTSVATSLTISGPQQILADSCQAMSVSRLDVNGNWVVANSSVQVSFSASGGAQFYSDANCSTEINTALIGVGQYKQNFFVRRSVAAAGVTLTAADSASVLATVNRSVDFVAALTWWNAAWKKRVRIHLNNLDQAQTLTNQAVLVKLDTSVIDYTLFQAAGQDLRFVASDDSTALSYEIESWNPLGTSFVWVKVPTIAASSDSTAIYLYFNNPSASDGQNKNGVWSSYNTVWHLGDNLAASAPQIKDSSGTNRHGTIENSPVQVSAIIGKGLNLGGNLDGFDVGNLVPTLGVSTTMSYWLKTKQPGNGTNWLAPGITGVEESGGTNDIFFGWIDNAGVIAVTAGNGVGAKSNFVVNDSAWRHITITRNSVTGLCKFYVNGVLNGSGTSGVGTITTSFTKIGQIRNTGGAPTNFDGSLDEIRIFSSVLNDAQIRADYKFQTGSALIFNASESAP